MPNKVYACLHHLRCFLQSNINITRFIIYRIFTNYLHNNGIVITDNYDNHILCTMPDY